MNLKFLGQLNLLPKIFIYLVLGICILIFILEIVNQRFWLNDFKVYYLASEALLQGNNVYGVAFGLDSGFYKYAPFVLLLFYPLTLLPYKVASIIYFFIICFAILSVFNSVKGLFSRYFSEKNPSMLWGLVILFLFNLNLLHRELHLGNTNMILIAMVLIIMRNILIQKYLWAGILLAIVLLFKPFFILILLPLILFKKWKVFPPLFIMEIAQLFLFFIIFGWNTGFTLHLQWIQAILSHSTGFPSANNLAYLLNFHFHIQVFPNFQTIMLLGIFFCYTIFFFLDIKYHLKNKSKASALLFGTYLLLAILPTILNTDTEHFLYSLPLISFIIFTIFEQKKWWYFVVMGFIFLLYGINTNDLVGKLIGDILNRIGALGISNLLLIILGLWIYLRKKHIPSKN